MHRCKQTISLADIWLTYANTEQVLNAYSYLLQIKCVNFQAS